MFLAVSILGLVLLVASLLGIAVGIRKKNRMLLIIAAIIYASLLIFVFGAYGGGNNGGNVLPMIGGLGIAVGVGLKHKTMWIPSIILIIIVYIMNSLR